MSRLAGEEYRVYGPPGTGKTTWLTSKGARLAEKFGEDQVSICSLTRSAVREVVGREIPIDPDNITTLHARCKRALSAPEPAEVRVKEFIKEYPQHGGENCIPNSLIRNAKSADDDENTNEVMLSTGGITLYEQAQINRQQMIPKGQWNPEVLKWFNAWDRWCKERGLMDFTGWLETALEINPLPAQQVVFVDEAQDHTPLQLAVIRAWRCNKRVLVGDDDQNLYEWSGAIPDRFFLPEIGSDREKVLSQSYRVPRAVHREAMRWANRISKRKQKVYSPRDADGWVEKSHYSLRDARVGELPNDLLSNPHKTYMLLTTCGYMLNDVVDNLRERRIPFHNPYRKSNKKWNPLDSVAEKIDSFMNKAEWTGEDIQTWAKVLKSTGVFLGSKDDLMAKCEYWSDMVVDPNELSKYFMPKTFDRIMKRDLSIFREFRKAGVSGSWDYALDVFKKSADASKPRVIVGTIHSVKGGESDVVYLFPDLSPAGYWDYSGHMSDRISRLFYVGVTRAREGLNLCMPSDYKAVDW